MLFNVVLTVLAVLAAGIVGGALVQEYRAFKAQQERREPAASPALQR
jgi:hypothetical protein